MVSFGFRGDCLNILVDLVKVENPAAEVLKDYGLFGECRLNIRVPFHFPKILIYI